jgi:cytochrome c553
VTRAQPLVAAHVVALLALASPAAVGAGGASALADVGERWWRVSPDPRDPVACATCHHDPEATRGWAASFPKVKPMPPPHTRVMTLLQATAEAVRRHYGLGDPLPAATAITAYLTARGAGVPLSPGAAEGQPVLPERMRALAASVARGRALHVDRCASCHEPARLAALVTKFPRAVGARTESVERFVEGHARGEPPLAWEAPAMADLIAYLVSHRAGRPLAAEPFGAGEDHR